MRYPASWNLATFAIGLSLACCTALSLGISEQEAAGQAASRPPLPCTWSADGVFQPKRDTWGWNQTRWRPWPGDDARLKPVPTDGTVVEEVKDELKAFERPSAQQEDLRGLPKDDKKEHSNEDLPDDEVLPDAEIQGRALPNPQIPQSLIPQSLGLPAERNVARRTEVASPAATENLQEDAPPRLPASLKRLAAKLRGLPPVRQTSARTNPHAAANAVAVGGVVRAAWQQPASMPLVNPAAAATSKPGGDRLRQAIYYEASDRPADSIIE